MVADRLVADAKDRIAAGDLLRAQSIVDSVRRIQPNHRELADVTASLYSAREFERVALEVARSNSQGNSGATLVATLPAVSAATRAGASTPSAAEREAARSKSSSVAPSKVVNASSGKSFEKSVATGLVAVNQASAPVNDSSLSLSQSNSITAGQAVQVPLTGDTALGEAALIAEQKIAPANNPADAGSNSAASERPANYTSNGETKLVKYVAPVYPQKARTDRVEAWVDVHFLVASDGSVIKPRVENGSRDAAFRSAALAAVSQWKYSPAPTGASPNRPMIVRMKFQLADGKRS